MRRWWVAMMLAACGDNVDSQATGIWGANLAVADDTIFFTTYAEGPDKTDHAVWARPLVGGPDRKLWQGAPDGAFGTGMAVFDGRVYWPAWEGISEGEMPIIASAPSDGGERTIDGALPSRNEVSGGVIVDATGIYAAQSDAVTRLDRGGGGTTVLHSGTPGIRWIARDSGSLYVTTIEQNPRLLRLGAVSQELIASGQYTGTFAIADKVAYLGTNGAIVRVSLDGTTTGLTPLVVDGDAQIVVAGAAGVFAVVTNRALGVNHDQIVRVAVDGSSPEVLRDGLEYVFALVLADNHLVFAQCDCSAPGLIGVIEL
ncbi:MAG TPA: hypothetical protein VMZ53_28805 [Kofleriaceae bacterium]|nr:hypothetical protein [Kofleriaceae bacterium]